MTQQLAEGIGGIPEASTRIGHEHLGSRGGVTSSAPRDGGGHTVGHGGGHLYGVVDVSKEDATELSEHQRLLSAVHPPV